MDSFLGMDVDVLEWEPDKERLDSRTHIVTRTFVSGVVLSKIEQANNLPHARHRKI